MITGIVILAAGSSSRLGQPKQKLLYKEKTLLQRAVDAAVNSVCKPIIVVAGALDIDPFYAITGKAVYLVENENWYEGIGSSIKCGIIELQKIEPAVTDAVIMLCDQPFVNEVLLNDLVKKRAQSGKGIIACFYNDTFGVPALFHKNFFPQLLNLQGNEGAKKIILGNKSIIASVPFPLGTTDIDTAEDYDRLIADY